MARKRERWNVHQCTAHINEVRGTDIQWRTFTSYVSRGQAPASVGYNPETGEREWDAQQIREWASSRRGMDWRKGLKGAHGAQSGAPGRS